MELTDWRGHPITVGTQVLWARGKSPELSEGTVLDVFEVYYDPKEYRFVRLEEGQTPPKVKHYGKYYRPEGSNDWKRDSYMAPAKTHTRVKVQPIGKSSRSSVDYGSRRWNNDQAIWEDTGKTRPVTLVITKNVTALPEGW